MKKVTLYEIKERQVQCANNYVEIMHCDFDDILPIESGEFLLDKEIKKTLLPVQVYHRVGEKPRYIALSREVKEILDIEIENTDTNRCLRGKIDLLKEENDCLNKTLKKCQDMSVTGHVKIIFNKIFKGV